MPIRRALHAARAAALCWLALAAAAPLAAIDPPRGGSPVSARAFVHPDLWIPPVHRAPGELDAAVAGAAQRDLALMGVRQPAGARLDLRGLRWSTLLPGASLLPAGAGGAAAGGVTPLRASQALAGYVAAHRAELRLDPDELAWPGRVAIHDGGGLIQIHAPRVVDGVPVRDSYLTAVIRRGNLVLLGAERWGDVEVSARPALDADEAMARLQAYVEPAAMAGSRGKPHLVLVPLARGGEAARIVPGRGYAHRLAWVLRPAFTGDLASWEALVDAHSGEILSLEDTNHYGTARRVQGGVYPLTNDGVGSEGTEQAGWPMPFDLVTAGSDTHLTDSGGNAPICLDGDVISTLSGQFVEMSDSCGAIGLTATGDLDFGASGGDDCTTPGSGGAGNTHSSRTGFHELNRIREQAAGQLPGNAWLAQRLTANMNINQSCNAFWNGATVNFYRSGVSGGTFCANTGEIAGVFDHEWGHGMDDNDVNPSISSPGEGIADIYAYLRLDTSCIGRGFRPGVDCPGFLDPCTACDGVRDIDWAKRDSGAPHDVKSAFPTGIDALCGAGETTPCGGYTHCEGAVYAEAVYDLVNRDLPSLFGMDHNTALEVVTRLTYLGAGPVGSWFQCVSPYGGCGAAGGYLNYLAADDDNGDLGDGTPHMSAIFAAFDRHGIACDTPAVVDSGCAGAPTAAPVVTATAIDRGAQLSWGAVAGAQKYQVFRADGVSGCASGKVKVGETTGTTFTDGGLQNGRVYSYVVLPIGAADACIGPAGACTAVTPVAGYSLAVVEATIALVIDTGDGDDFLDSCETATVSFDVENNGTGAQTNVRVAAVRPVSHPDLSVTSIDPVSPAALAGCERGAGGFDFTAGVLGFGDTVVFEIDVTSDELSPRVESRTLVVAANAQSDFEATASKTWGFESDLDGWSVVQGTFGRATAGGGAPGSPAGYMASSTNLDDQCDQVRSPALRLTAASTLSLATNYGIERFSYGSWWDRANVAIYADGVRTAVAPDSGRPYNASGPGASCVTQGQGGWADSESAWGSSGWSASALGAAGLAGKTVWLDVAYGTDEVVNGKGFWFDQVTLTDFELQVPDGRPITCNAPPVVAISAPAEGAEFTDADSIAFAGSASDTEDGALDPALAWSSDIAGAIGTGASFATSLAAGFHTVTASATDSLGETGSDAVHVAVASPPGCPVDLVVDNLMVPGVAAYRAVKSVTLGADTELQDTADVTVEAGQRIDFVGPVALGGTAAFTLTPTPCP